MWPERVRTVALTAALVAILLLPVSGCGSSQSIVERQGPDATLARLPVDATDATWPSNDLRTMVVRPTFDESPAGITSFDGRTTLAILDPERATWVLGARLTDQQGLDLTDQIQQLIVQDSFLEDHAHALEVHLLRQPEDGSTSMDIEGGQWRVLTTDASNSGSIIRFGVVNAHTGELVGEAAMDGTGGACSGCIS